MMALTHGAVGVAIGATLLAIAPEYAAVAALAGAAGGLFPDLDVVVGTHRRTLHFPVLYWLPAVPAVAMAALSPEPLTVAVALFLVSAAVHSATDVLGAGTELRPWRGTSDRGVHLHPASRWLRARRLVRYDGSPEDFLLMGTFSLPGLLLFDGPVRTVSAGGLLLAGAYVAVRKRLPDLAEWLAARIGA